MTSIEGVRAVKSPDSVYLVRHGETAWSKTGQHTGRTDLELTEQGERDAVRLGGGLTVDKVFTSPLKRALRTCELAGFGGAATILDGLVEWNYGAYEGKTSQEIRAGRPDWELFRDGCPDGESVAQISARVDAVIAGLRQFAGNVLIFSSGHVLRVLAARWLGCEAAFGRYLALDPTSLSQLGFEHGHEDPVLRLWNDARRG
jgi:probable phosphoglycerate mutase